jgi:hypothetical protein
MPRFFFHAEDGKSYPDEFGSELPDLEAARRKATLVMAELLKEEASDFLDTGRLRIAVMDAAGQVVIRLEAVLEPRVA